MDVNEGGVLLRRDEYPEKQNREEEWLTSTCHAPVGVVDSQIIPSFIAAFKDLIWNNKANEIISDYGMTPEQMARLCGEGDDGWLLSSHIDHILNKMTTGQGHTLCLCLSATCASSRMTELRDRHPSFKDINQLVFAINVGKLPDNSVRIGSDLHPGNHWTIAVVKLSTCEVVYCDSLAWGVPDGLLARLEEYTSFFNVRLPVSSITVCHTPTPMGEYHICQSNCTNYPLQSCPNICGVIVIVCAAIATFNPTLFDFLCGPRSTRQITRQFYLRNPTKHAKYLRCVLISWFMTGIINIHNVSLKELPKSDPVLPVLEHTPAQAVKSRLARKRKITTDEKTVQHKNNINDCVGDKVPMQPTATDTQSTLVSDKEDTNEHVIIVIQDENNSNDCVRDGVPIQPTATDNQSTLVSDKEDTNEPVTTGIIIWEVQPKNNINDCVGDEVPMQVTATDTQSTLVSDKENTNEPVTTSASNQVPSTSSKFVCPYCQDPLASRQSLHRHKKRVHPNEKKEEPARATIQCCICNTFCCGTMKELIHHLNSAHGTEHQIQQAEFKSERAFLEWKSSLEKFNATWFVKSTGEKSYEGHLTRYYSCNRSGVPVCKSNVTRRRSLKSQGSSKMKGNCCAFLKCTTYKRTRKIAVEYCVDHIGHDTRIAHLKMSDELRSFVVEKLTSSVDSKVILDEIRDDMSKLDGRDKLVTLKDICNIKKQYHISPADKDENDSTSTHTLVHNLQSQEYDPIVIFKAQDIQQFDLVKENFLLGIQTEFQRDIMTEFGPNAICIDSTHKMTEYDFLVTTVAVFDDYGEAIPVAWLISDREDETVLVPFMEALLKRVGDIKCNVFMSDLASKFYNAWCCVFQEPALRLYCTWNVKKNWKKNVLSKVKGDGVQKEVTTMLDIVLYEPDENEFTKLLLEVLAKLETIAPEFQKYFVNSFVVDDKVKLWAACFRKGTVVNTNTYIEALNRVLKNKYLKKKQNTRVDELLVAFLKIAKDKAHERFIKLEKGKVTSKIKETRKRHLPGVELIKNIEVVTEGEVWSIASLSSKDSHHIVKKAKDSCNCKLKCSLCKVCLHMFTCSCLDYLIHSVACKHVHSVKMCCNESEMDGLEAHDAAEYISTNHDKYFSRIVQKSGKESDLTEIKKAAADDIANLSELVKSSQNATAVSRSMKHIKAAIAAMKGL